MRCLRWKGMAGILAVILWSAGAGIGQAQVTVSPPNFTVTTPGNGFEFDVNGADSGLAAMDANVDDSLNFTLNAGATYLFSMSTGAIHPVDICTNPNISSFYIGASAQAVHAGTVKVTIPATNYPSTLYYICNVHTFYGIITVAPHSTAATRAAHPASVGHHPHRAYVFGRNQHDPVDTSIQLQPRLRRVAIGSELHQQFLREFNEHDFVSAPGRFLRAICFSANFAGYRIRSVSFINTLTFVALLLAWG